MAKKIQHIKDSVITITLTEPYRLSVKFAPKALIPVQAVDKRWLSICPTTSADWKLWSGATFVTNDLKKVKFDIISVTNNNDGRYDERFDNLCQELYKMSFTQVKSIWKSRFGYLDNYWYVVKLTECGN